MKTPFVFLFVLLSVWPACAQPGPGDSAKLLDALVGRWVLTGSIAGKPTTHDVSASWVLGRGYLQLHEVSRETTAGGAPAYEALVYLALDGASQEFSCLWLDTTGNGGLSASAVGHARAEGRAIPFVFRAPDGTGLFENTFSFDPDKGTWTWRMVDLSGGKRAEFATLTLARP